MEELLCAAGKTYGFHRYDDAGHASFSVDRPSYRVAAALDGWERIRAFYGRHLTSQGAWRVAVELSLDSARALLAALQTTGERAAHH